MTATSFQLGSARVSRAGFDVAPEQSFLCIPAALNRSESKEKFAIGSTRSPARETRALPRFSSSSL
jgi:hypothetical protein